MPDILEKVVNESYRPLFQGLLDTKEAKLILNINAVLTEMLSKAGYQDVLDTIRSMASDGRLEFTESAKYHAFLPLLPQREIERQIISNHQTNEKYFGRLYQPRGFFPPEMAYSKRLARVVKSLGYEWLLLDELAYAGKVNGLGFNKSYLLRDVGLKLFFRERRTSNLIMGALVRQADTLVRSLAKEMSLDRYLLTAMDGETFGHHRPGLERVLFDLYRGGALPSALISDLVTRFPESEEVEPVPCTWASSEKDLLEGLPYKLWRDPSNVIHRWKWQLTHLALQEMEKARKKGRLPGSGWQRARQKLDESLNSCHFWWASPYGWWSLEMVEAGSYQVLEALQAIPGVSKKAIREGRSLYEKIVFKAFEWQRSGYIRSLFKERESWRKVPFKDRSEAGQFEAVINLLAKEERLASRRGEYEQAIKWRDGREKLEQGLDIYDAMHIVDQLRAEGKLGEFSELTRKYARRYRRLVPGQEL